MPLELDFDFDEIDTTEFGAGQDDGEGQAFAVVPADGQVQGVLADMARTTWQAIEKGAEDPIVKYEPSEKHAATECLYLPLQDELASMVRLLHQAANLEMDADALSLPAEIFCYFARFTDNHGRRVTALRRASQFKGILKSRNRLTRLVALIM